MSRNGKDDRPATRGEDRDEVDRKITRSVRAARAPRGVPAPGPAEPADDALLRYLEGSADGDERRLVEDAAKQSPFTGDRLQILGDALRETGHAPSAASLALGGVARWAFAVAKDTLTFLRGVTAPIANIQPAWATRGEPARDTSFYEFKQDFSDVEALVRVEHVTRPKASPTLDLQVRLVEGGNPQNNGRVTIRRAGRTIDSIPTENDGSATFTGLAPDRYEVELRTTGQVIGVMVLDFLSA